MFCKALLLHHPLPRRVFALAPMYRGLNEKKRLYLRGNAATLTIYFITINLIKLCTSPRRININLVPRVSHLIAPWSERSMGR